MPKKTTKKITKKRAIDVQAQETISFWSKTFVLIQKTQIKTWQGIFIVAFITGVFTALILAAYAGMQQTTHAGQVGIGPNPPANQCRMFPEGGSYEEGQGTTVMIRCGKLVRRAHYQWEGEAKKPIFNPRKPGDRYIDTKYKATRNQKLKITGKWRLFIFEWPFRAYSKTFTVAEPKCNDDDGGEQIDKPGTCTDKYGSISDICMAQTASSSLISEAYCDNNTKRCEYKDYDCYGQGFEGCETGACIGCNDTEGNIDYGIKGITRTFSDACISLSTLQEFSCQGNDAIPESVSCSSGCVDGACIQETCDSLAASSSSAYYFQLCKNEGYDNVCFNKYTSQFDGCTRDSYDDCIEHNIMPQQHILCDASIASSTACRDTDEGKYDYYNAGTVFYNNDIHVDGCYSASPRFYLNTWCDNNEIAIGGSVECKPKETPHYPITYNMPSIGSSGMSNVKYWSVNCNGFGEASIQAICTDHSNINYRISDLSRNEHLIDTDDSFQTVSYCKENEIAIGGYGGCGIYGGIYWYINNKPTMVYTEPEKINFEPKGWVVGCKGYGTAYAQAICVDRSDINISISDVQYEQHYYNDKLDYYSESYCNDGEIAIGGYGGCIDGGGLGHIYRPDMIANKYTDNSHTGWTAGCRGYGTAYAAAICVDENNLDINVTQIKKDTRKYYHEDLEENFCENDRWNNATYKCPNGCKNGACCDEPFTCGKYYYPYPYPFSTNNQASMMIRDLLYNETDEDANKVKIPALKEIAKVFKDKFIR